MRLMRMRSQQNGNITDILGNKIKNRVDFFFICFFTGNQLFGVNFPVLDPTSFVR